MHLPFLLFSVLVVVRFGDSAPTSGDQSVHFSQTEFNDTIQDLIDKLNNHEYDDEYSDVEEEDEYGDIRHDIQHFGPLRHRIEISGSVKADSIESTRPRRKGCKKCGVTVPKNLWRKMFREFWEWYSKEKLGKRTKKRQPRRREWW